MSESSEYTAETTPVTTTTADPVAERTVVTAESKPNRLYQAAAWVAIVAGTLFIVAVVFFSGFILGKSSGGSGHFGWHGRDGGHGMMMDRDGPVFRPGGPGMGWPGGPGEGPFGPGQPGPGGPGPGPGQQPGR